MMNAVFIWLIFSLFFFILELGHPGLLFFLSFSIGSLITSLFGLANYSWIAQIFIFFVSTLSALYVLHLFLKKFHRSLQKTNVYALIGKQGIVMQEIMCDQPGYVKVEGQIWLARSSRNAIIVVDDPIKVIDVRGAHLVVEHITHTL